MSDAYLHHLLHKNEINFDSIPDEMNTRKGKKKWASFVKKYKLKKKHRSYKFEPKAPQQMQFDNEYGRENLLKWLKRAETGFGVNRRHCPDIKTPVIKRMLKRDLLQAERSGTEKSRHTRLTLTPKGRALLNKLNKQYS